MRTIIEASVIVCTYTRAESLRAHLSTMKNWGAKPSRNWEVIVMYSNSKDHKCKVMMEFRQDHLGVFSERGDSSIGYDFWKRGLLPVLLLMPVYRSLARLSGWRTP